jgi:hypothetical protein
MITNIVDYDRMINYLWWEKTNPSEAKYGERWVFAGQDPQKEVWKRIKSSLGVRKDLIKDGTVVLEETWDVTELAKKVGRYYQRSRMDDYIRPQIGFRKGTTGEIHELSADEIKLKVNKYLAKSDQPLPIAGLSAWQARTIEQTIKEINNGKQTIIAELCARFGKTIWAGALTKETNIPLTVVVSYVLTSFSSFEKDLSGFEQFKDYVLVDTADDEYKETIDAALAQGKQVVAFLSMCVGAKRQLKIDYLFNQSCDRLIFVDEADFGVHRAGQAKPLIDARKDNDVIILMTGTNADRAASYWPVDTTLSVVYPELLMEKRLKQTSYATTLKHFSVDVARHELVVDIEFYQMDLKSAVEFARQVDPDAFLDDGIYLPSWSKFAAYPVKAKGFWSRMLQAVFLGQHGWDELNVDLQTERSVAKEGQRVAMMFLSGSMRNENLEEAVALAQQALPGFLVVAVYGDEMTNRTAEGEVKEAIERAKKLGQDVLLLSAGMAQRSFSVGSITELYLAYDTGDNGATIQKISRALTPDQAGKIGRIVSLSFDPNRDDKFDALLIETALNYKRTHNLKSAKEALRDVIRTVDIFRCTADGSIKLEGDDYLEHAIERKSVSRIVGKVADIGQLSVAELTALAEGNADAFRAAKEETAQRGKTKLSSNRAGGTKNTSDEMASAKLIARAREVITTVVENMDIIVYGAGTNILSDAFNTIKVNPEKRQAVEEEFGLDFDLIQELFHRGVINTDLVELQVDS